MADKESPLDYNTIYPSNPNRVNLECCVPSASARKMYLIFIEDLDITNSLSDLD
jgi:hypothetical protein